MILYELFDKKSNYTTDSNGNSQFTVNDKDYSVEFNHIKDGIYDVAFGLLSAPGYGGYRGTKYSMQGTGDELAVFSTVMEIVKQFVTNTSNLNTLTFSANSDEHSRIGLYDRLLKRFAAQYYTNKQLSDDGTAYYYIQKQATN